MSNLDWLLDDLGLEINKANRKEVDLAIRKYYGFTPEDECPKIWEKLKNLTKEERLELTEKLNLEER